MESDNNLRKKAEKIIGKEFDKKINNSDNFEDVIRELRVHQIELEAQNQELQDAQIKLENSRSKYYDLYNHAPVGYFTLNKKGTILNVNFTGAELLGVDDKNLNTQSFIQYIAVQDGNKFNSRINRAIETGTKQIFNVKLLKNRVPFNGHLEMVPVLDGDGCYKELNLVVSEIPEVKIENRTLKNTDGYSEIFFNNHTVMILIDPESLEIVDANPAAINFYGYSLDEIVKLKISDINVLDNDLVTQKMGNAISGTNNHFIFKHRLSNGEIRDVDVYSGLIEREGKNFLYSIIHDISERKKNEEDLKRQAALLDVSYEAIFSWEYDGNILSWNKGAERLYGYSADESIGKISHELLKTKFPIEFEDFNKKLIEDRMWRGELIHTTKNGQKIIVETQQQLITDPVGKIIVIESNRDITERKNAEETVNQTKKLLQDVINGFPSPIFVKDVAGRFLIINNKLEELLGVKNEEIVGKTDDDIISNELADIYRSNDLDVIESGKAITIEEEAELIDGYHTFIAHKFPIFNTDGEPYGVGSVSTDITERKFLEKELERARDTLQQKVEERTAELESSYKSLKESKEHYMTLFNSIDEGFCTIEVIFDSNNKPSDYKFLEINPAFAEQTGIADAEGKLMRDLAPDHEEYWFEYYGKIALTGEPMRFVSQAKALNRWYNVYAFKLGDQESREVAILFSDITKFKKLEKELREYQDTLEEKVRERTKALSESNKELEQFAYITSHDLREPLRMITSFLQLLERKYKDELDQDANDYIGFAVDGAKRLDAMTNDLLEYSRISSEKREISPVNFEHVLEEALLNLKVPIKENNAIITHDPLPTINANEKLKVQLFQNLIGNAIKYHGPDIPKIHVSAKKEKNQYLFSIEDNGIGMSHEHLEKIFTIFKRLHTHQEYDGTGIGLSIAQKIVQKQGGEIWAESELGKGSTFYFTIPLDS